MSVFEREPLTDIRNEWNTNVNDTNSSYQGTPGKKNATEQRHGKTTPAKPSPPGSENHGSTSSDTRELGAEERAKYNKLVTKAKELASNGKITQAVEYNKKALALYHTEKLVRRIAKMEAYLKECGDGSSEEDDDGDEMVHVGSGFYLYKELYAKLYAHQRDGVQWMWRLYKQRKGGILGDDMGLGKTIQVIAFLSGMFDAEKFHSVLIVLPVAVMINWEREFQKWSPGIRVEAFHGGSKRDRERMLSKIHRRGGVCLTSYGMLVNNADQLAKRDGHEYIWDSIILDEGHKIKNPSNKCSKGLHSVAARQRIILTGTPIQNNLKELWALFDWTHQGSLLGTARTFGLEFEGPIMRARQRDATSGEERLGQEMANSLKGIIEPYFLRRTKAQVTSEKQARANRDDASSSLIPKAQEMPTLMRKNDLVVWVYLSEVQQKIYEDFAHSEEVRELLNTSRSPLTALLVLKKICDHPRLLSNRQCLQLGLDMDDGLLGSGALDNDTQDQCAVNRIQHIADKQLIAESGKMVFLVELLDNLKAEGHRCLVFSQSRKMLDIIQKVTRARGHKVMRLDGTIRLLTEREEIISKFSRDKSYSVFLLTTQVGGVGLTLTAADRVVIFDPSWNPATDAQAVDRAFRIGQDKNVVIYRLITCGSVEEKIYRRQIFKDSVTKQTTGESKNPYKYFTKGQLYELFVLSNPRESETQQQLADIHSGQRKSDTWLDAHIAFLHALDMYGISDHDLMFSQESKPVEDEDLVGTGVEYIEQKVQRANQLITMESEENLQLTQTHGKYPAPEVNKVPRPAGPRAPPNWQWEPPKEFTDLTALQKQEPDCADLEEDVKNLHIKPEPCDSEGEDESANVFEVSRGSSDQNPIVLDSPVKQHPENVSNDSIVIEREHLSDEDVIADSRAEEENVEQEEEERRLSYKSRGEDVEEGMAVSDESHSDSYQTPTDESAFNLSGSPDRSGQQKREVSESAKRPTPKKRRRSVAYTPGRKSSTERPVSPNASMDDAGMDIIAEELVFSPKQHVMDAVPQEEEEDGDYSDDYEAFIEQANARSHSTVLFDRSKIGEKKRFRMSAMGEECPTVEESEAIEEGESIREEIEDSNSSAHEQDSTCTDESETAKENGIRGARKDSNRSEEVEDKEESRDGEMASRELSGENGVEDEEESGEEELGEEEEEDHGKEELGEEEEEDHGEEELGEEEEEDHGEEELGEEEAHGEEELGEEEEEEADDEEEDEDEEEEDEEELTEEQEEQYLKLMKTSREYYKQNNYMKALQYCLEGLDIYAGDERAQRYALKLQHKLQT